MLLLVLTLFNPISLSWVELRLHTEFQLPMLLKSGSFMVGDKQKRQQVSMKLMASLAPTRGEVESGAVAKLWLSCG